MKQIILILVMAVFFSSCEEEKTIFVADHLVSCEGSFPQKCMLVRENEDDQWQNFYDNIEGFTFVEGYTYKLKVKIEKIAEPKADASGLKYTLIDIISKTKTKKETMTIRYTANSRGYGSTLLLKDNLLSFDVERPTPQKIEKQLSDADIDSIDVMLHSIDLNTLDKLVPPSTAHQYDGAPGAVFAITIGDKSYRTPTFDYGNPPEEIKALIEKLEKLK
jgi:hypothetical protein